MTPRTSSGSWSVGRGAGADAIAGAEAGAGGRTGDIIDLDRYMRGTRPARAPPRPDNINAPLVVDGGLGARAAAAARSTPSSRSSGGEGGGGGGGGGGGAGRGKRFSHDSGLSDTSCARRPHAHRPHRCVGGTQVSAPAGGGARSSASLRAFRASLERALRDQQAQIARVAQLCERQAGRRAERRTDHRAERRAPRKTPTDSTELSSSSCSSRDPRHADKHRSSECKTYKIIMSKLDELNRLFAARARPASPAAPAPAPPAAPGDSSGSVTVSDKLVATDFPQQGSGRRASSQRLVERGAGGECRAEAGAGARAGAGAGAGAARGGAHVIACAHSIDIPPRSTGATESAARARSSEDSEGASAGSGGSALRGGFDLDDPVHLYAQAKRLQAMHATTRRARSASAECAARARSELGSELGSALGSAQEPSLCALCRGYWRLARRCLTAPLAGMRL